VHPEIQELQSKLKEILYDCAVDVRATKAALFLLEGENRYELVTEYGFRGGIRASADRTDPIVDRCGRGRTPFFVNGLAAEPRFAELMYESATDRLLGAPIYLRGHLVGIIDMRDKAGRALFEPADLPKAQRIAERIAEVFASKNVFGQRYITLSDSTNGGPQPAVTSAAVNTAAPAPRPLVAKPPPAPNAAAAEPPAGQRAHSRVPRLSTLILEARTAADRLTLAPPTPSLGEAELAAIRDVLRSMLLLPGASVAGVSAFGHLGGVQEIVARAQLTDDAAKFLQSKLAAWLAKRGDAAGELRTRTALPFGAQTAPITPAEMQKVFTAPVAAGSLRGVYLTVAFAATPDRTVHELLGAFHAQLQLAIEHSLARAAMQTSRSSIAHALLAPDFTEYPELRSHSDAVVARVEVFARFVALSPAETENARLVALVHDAGMRLLEYDRLYRKRELSPDELSILREHPAVGAALVEPLLGREIARAVLCHHERWDGRGYPANLSRADIPLEARIVQICDVYETMIAADSYAPAEPREKAVAKIAEAAGGQFDPELAHRFLDMLRAT
jgi:hypothetical protein